MSARVFVVVTAAGQSRRMGGIDKLTLPLHGRPLIACSVGVFLDWPKVFAVAVAVTAGREQELRDAIAGTGTGTASASQRSLLSVLAGGRERQDSIRLALEHLESRYSPTSNDVVLIHDAARPFIDEALLESLLEALAESDGVIPATPVRDTVKRVSGSAVLGTEDRESLRLVQTPQAFGFSQILDYHRQAHAEGYLGTDDASLVERYGGTVCWIAGPAHNLKVTVAEDIALLEHLHQRSLEATK